MFVAYYPHLAGLFQREKAEFAEFVRPGTRGFARKHSASNAAGASPGLLLTGFYVLWFGVSVWRRK
jgi:hypothetical protein